jgi:tRNA-2-methylthio-N6-dimethylallyladenosine synthase
MSIPRVRTRALAPPGPTGPAAGSPAVHVVTFGCQMNKYDSLFVEGRFLAEGWRLVERPEEADAILFNTCSVREHAEERVYSWVGALRRAKERRPELVIGVLGCMAQRAGEEIFARAAHVDIVCGTKRIADLPAMVQDVRARRAETGRGETARRIDVDLDGEVRADRSAEPYTGGLAGHLAVMRGCDLNCTFCIVPAVRGRVQSRSLSDVVAEARWMVDGGARVITLLGQTVNSYGEDLAVPEAGEPRGRGRGGRPGLADVLYALQEIEGLVRIRLVTLHPSYVTSELARAIERCDKVDRFLPLPAQSGSDAILRRMKRGYTTDLYRERVALLREVVPDLELGSDWIVGFPGETEDDFERSVAFLGEIGFLQSYVFQFDPRPGTRAAGLVDDVPAAAKKERNHRLLEAGEQAALARNRAWIGREVEVFVEEASARRPGWLRGRSRHNLPVSWAGPAAQIGGLVRVRVGEATAFGVSGIALA